MFPKKVFGALIGAQLVTYFLSHQRHFRVNEVNIISYIGILSTLYIEDEFFDKATKGITESFLNNDQKFYSVKSKRGLTNMV